MTDLPTQEISEDAVEMLARRAWRRRHSITWESGADEDRQGFLTVARLDLTALANIRERYPATALELERPGPGEAMTCPTCNRTIGVTRHGRLASHYKPSTLARCEGDDRG